MVLSLHGRMNMSFHTGESFDKLHAAIIVERQKSMHLHVAHLRISV